MLKNKTIVLAVTGSIAAHLTISHSHVFLVNSRLDHFSAPYK